MSTTNTLLSRAADTSAAAPAAHVPLRVAQRVLPSDATVQEGGVPVLDAGAPAVLAAAAIAGAATRGGAGLDALAAARRGAPSYADVVSPNRARAAAAAVPVPARPTMVELRSILDKHAVGNLTFDDVLPLLPHDARDVVGWLYMETGAQTRHIDVATAIHSLLHDNQQPDLAAGLVNIIKCERDLQKGMMRWGFATSSAMTSLQGKALRLRVRRQDKGFTTCSFTMTEPHAMDGFYMDLPAGLRSRAEERRLFELLARLEPRFLWGAYLDVSPTTHCAGTRYRLYFLGSTVPSTMMREGRMVEELVFLGRRLRVYGEGWYFQDKYLARLDLDLLGRSYGATTVPQGPTTATETRRAPVAPAPKAKKSRPVPQDGDGFAEVRSRKSRRPTTGAPEPAGRPENRPWTSPNAFSALAEHWVLAHDVHSEVRGTTTLLTITPDARRASGTPHRPTTGEYVTCLPVIGGTPTPVEVSVDSLIEGIKALDTKAQAQALHLPAQLDAALARPNFDLAKLTRTSRVDALASNLERYPVDFAVQLHALYAHDRPVFDLFVGQRLLHRWLRATWGGGKSFDQLYTATFGRKPSQGHVAELFSGSGFAAGLEPTTCGDSNGDEVSFDRVAIETVLAVAEVLLAAHAPLFFVSDAALVACTHSAIGVIASHQGSRSLSSASLAYFLFASQLGQDILECLRRLYTGDAAMQQAILDAECIYDDGAYDYNDGDQVMLHPSQPQLVAGDLTDPRAALVAPRGAASTSGNLADDPKDVEMVSPATPGAVQGVSGASTDADMVTPAAPTATLDVAALG
jgi:hypothetical protein